MLHIYLLLFYLLKPFKVWKQNPKGPPRSRSCGPSSYMSAPFIRIQGRNRTSLGGCHSKCPVEWPSRAPCWLFTSRRGGWNLFRVFLACFFFLSLEVFETLWFLETVFYTIVRKKSMNILRWILISLFFITLHFLNYPTTSFFFLLFHWKYFQLCHYQNSIYWGGFIKTFCHIKLIVVLRDLIAQSLYENHLFTLKIAP